MAITIINQPKSLTPIYDDIIIKYDNIGASDDAYYKIEVLINNEYIRTFSVLPDPDGKTELNLNKILYQFIDTSIFENNSNNKEIITDYLLYFSLTGTSFDGETESSISSGPYYAFNGVSQPNNYFNINDFLVGPTNSPVGKVLNTNSENMVTKLTESLFLQTFNSTDSNYTDITVIAHYKDGSSDSAVYSTPTSSTFSIMSLDISPLTIQSNTTLIMDDTLDYYIVGDSNSFQDVTVRILEDDPRFLRQFRLAYVDSLGATDYINFKIGYEESLKIDKSTFINNNKIQVYNNTVENEITVISEYLTNEESNQLKDLWVSPLVMDVSNSNNVEIILNVSSVIIKTKMNTKLISYEIPFKYAENYKVIKK